MYRQKPKHTHIPMGIRSILVLILSFLTMATNGSDSEIT